MPLVGTRGAASAQGFGEFAKQTAVNYIEDVFSTYLYTGNGGAQTITNGIDVKTKGGLIWAKSRSGADDHRLWDTSRGGWLVSNTTGSSQAPSININNTNTYMYATTSGFAYGVDSGTGVGNDNGTTYASWTFRKQPKFFDVVTYTGDGATSKNISHNLGSVPGCIIVKRTNAAQGWAVYHRSVGNTASLFLNNTNAPITYNGYWNDTSPTSTQFTVGVDNLVNASGGTYVAYLFAHNAGGFGTAGTDNVISCGSFTTDSTGLATVTLGYEPQWILYKKSATTSDWTILDTMRGMAITASNILAANTSAAEVATVNLLTPTATGFVAPSAGFSSNTSYIYIAIRRGPMKTPTTGASVFEPAFATANSPEYKSNTVISGFDSAIAIYRPGYSTGSFSYPFVATRLIGQPYVLFTSNTNAQYSYSTAVTFAFNTGWFTGTFGNDTNREAYMFKRAPGFHDVVCYTGTASAGAAFNHNLGAVPELMIVKCRSSSSPWYTNSQYIAANEYLRLNTNNAKTTSVLCDWNNQRPTSTVFYLGNDDTNSGNTTYVAYLFASCPGVSKVGSYSGTGANQTIDCGFASGVRWVLIKRTDTTGDWYVYDTTRGMTSGTDPYILLNSTAAEVTGTNYVETIATGFRLIGSNAGTNASGGTYIYLAIA